MTTLNQLTDFFEREIVRSKPNGADRLSADQELLESGILSSIALVELIAHLEQTYHISVEIDDVIPGNFDTLQSLSDFINRKTQSNV